MQLEYLSSAEASNYLFAKFNLRYSVQYLAKLRCTTSDGPTFVNLGRRIYYRPTDLELWVSGRRKVFQTTSERSASAACELKHHAKGPNGSRKSVPSHSVSRDLDIFELLAGRPG